MAQGRGPVPAPSPPPRPSTRHGLSPHFPRDSYWGPSMWVRTNFNYHLVLAGVHVACIDADVVFTADPIPILFNPKAGEGPLPGLRSRDPEA